MIKKCSIFFVLTAAIIFAAPGFPRAQGFIEPFVGSPGGPGCSDLVNKTDFKVYGTVRTDSVKLDDGTMARHEANFAIPAGDSWRICSEGPFFDGGKIELQIKTLIPVFECLTRLGQPITISARRRSDGEGYDWFATCY